MKPRTLTNLCSALLLTAGMLSPLAGVAAEGNVPEPEVTVRHEDGHTLYEYRANGLLYMIKVVPPNGKPYFLVDPDGMGNYIRMDKSDLLIPSWIIHSW